MVAEDSMAVKRENNSNEDKVNEQSEPTLTLDKGLPKGVLSPTSSSSSDNENPEQPNLDIPHEGTGSEHSERTPPRTPEQPEPGKLFIGGLSHDTTPETLRDYFEKFGDVQEVSLMVDNMNRSRGFGFVTYQDEKVVDTVRNSAPHIIDSKTVDVKIALPKGFPRLRPSGSYRGYTPRMSESPNAPQFVTRKVFIGGVRDTTTNDDLEAFFSAFGPLENCNLMMDRETNRHRGFAFVTFVNVEDAAKVCSMRFHQVNGKKVEAKAAIPKEQMNGRSNGRHNNQNGSSQLLYAPPPLGAAGQVPPSPYPQPAGGYQIPTQGQFVPDQYTLLTGYFLQTADYPFNTPVFAPYTFTNAFAPGQN